MSVITNGYINRGREPINKWTDLNFNDFASLKDEVIPKELIPLFGSKHFAKLSIDEKETMYFEYIKFIAELILYLEYQFSSTFIEALQKENLSLETMMSSYHLVEEEAFHTEAYQKFLQVEQMDQHQFLMNNTIVLKATEALIRLSPASILIPAAKSEAFSVYYSRHLKKYYKEWNSNRWSYLNYLHLLDESHHVPFQIEIYNEIIANSSTLGRVRAFVGSMGFFLLMQYIAVYSMWVFIKRCMPKKSIFSRIIWTARIIKWTLIDFTPIHDSRIKIQTLLSQKDVAFGRIYKLLYR
jgi:hypothetical protein